MKPSDLKKRYPGYETFTFGDSKELCEKLTSLVVRGKKTATCESLDIYESGKEAMPKVGRIDIAVNWNGNPVVAIRTLEVEVIKFCDVEDKFALEEGENNDLAGWRKEHQEYFERSGRFNPDMKLVCERFEVIEVFD